jgi:Lactonase, 7-bladed beta-propeller
MIALAVLCVLSVFLLNCGSSSDRPSGVLYVLTEGANGIGNNVTSFTIDLDSGNLSLVNSNATVTGLPLSILLDPTGATAFVLSQTAISTYPVNSDGSLGGATSTALANTAIAMTRDAAGQFLFVLEAGSNPPPANCPLVGSNDSMYAGCPSVQTFAISGATLTPSAGSPFYLGKAPTALSVLAFPAPSSGTTPACGFTTSEEFLYITSNQDLSQQHNDNALSVYCVDSSGNLTDKTPDPPYTPQVDPISVQAVNTNQAAGSNGGVFVYVGSQPSSSGGMSIFQMCTVVGVAGCLQADVTNALLVPVGTTPPPTGQNPVAMVVDPTNNFLYVVCYGSNQIAEYRINTTAGTLSTPAYQPTGSQPVALALHPSVDNTGQYLYVSNSTSSNITGVTLSTTTGAMSNAITVVAPAAPGGMAAR